MAKIGAGLPWADGAIAWRDGQRSQAGDVQRRIFVCGDVHLGAGPTTFLTWLEDLRGREPGRLILLGDVVEYWTDDGRSVRAHAGLFAGLRALRQRGWHIDMVTGNRELLAGRRFACAGGLRLFWPFLDVRTPAGVIRIVHGDRLCRDPRYQFFAAAVRGFWTRGLSAMLPAWFVHGCAQVARWRSKKRQAGHGTDVKVATSGMGAALRLLDPARVAGAGRGARAMIAGHIHAQVHARIKNLDFWLVGDWPGTAQRWLEIAPDGTISRGHSRS